MENETHFRGDKKRQANFLLPELLIEELRRLVPSRQRSRVVAEALDRELARIKVRVALGEYFGAWKPSDARE
jgi:hypothetical protein